MKRKLIVLTTAAIIAASLTGSLSAEAFGKWSYSENLTVYVNSQKIDNDAYKPIIVNDRTLVRIVPVFEALDYSHTEMDSNKSVSFAKNGTNDTYTFTAESSVAIIGSDGEDLYNIEVPAKGLVTIAANSGASKYPRTHSGSNVSTSSSSTASNYTAYPKGTNGGLNVRSAASITSSIFTTMPEGAACTVNPQQNYCEKHSR